MLCSRCQNFDIHAFRQGGYEYRGYPLNGLFQSAEAKCSFCSLLLEHLLLAEEDGWRANHLGLAMRKRSNRPTSRTWRPSKDRVGIVIKWVAGLIRPPWVHFYVRRGNYIEPCGDDEQMPLNIKALGAYVSSVRTKEAYDGISERAIWFHLAADPGTPAYISRDITGQLQASIRTGTGSDFDAIRAWHRRCRLNHPKCRVTLSGSETFNAEEVTLPSRCIEIESEDNGQTIKKCVLRETHGMKGKYIILSHRWGADTETVKTLTTNYDCRTDPQKCAVVTATTNGGSSTSCVNCKTPMLTTLFRHACEIAAKLGVSYVWIDSLCIVQDDADDWKVESAKMADYYQHAWLTIAATRTTPDAGGLFGEYETTDLARVARLPYRDRHGALMGFFYLQCTGGKAISRDFKNAISRSELLGRGWVYQEWLLSRRILAFADFGWFMQCETGCPKSLAGDDVKFVRDDEDGDEWNTAEKPDKSFKSSVKTNLSSVANIAAGWRQVVEEYSRLQLTKLPEDRLVALSGIATEYGRAVEARQRECRASGAKEDDERLRYTYLCGSWFPEVRELLWEQAEYGSRFRAQGIPTWSWASIGTTITITDTSSTTITTTSGQKEIRSGVAVRWSFDAPQACELEGFTRIAVNSQTLCPEFDRCADESYVPDNVYGNDGRFAALHVSGRLAAVEIHSLFADEDDRTAAANVTGHRPAFGREVWRRVTTPQTPGIVAGWASLEHPDFQDGNSSSVEVVMALFAAVRTKVQGGWLLGNASPHLTAYDVLYLRRVQIPELAVSPAGKDRDCYERVGVGRLFGGEVDNMFKSTEKSKIWLV